MILLGGTGRMVRDFSGGLFASGPGSAADAVTLLPPLMKRYSHDNYADELGA
jgi:hypothetical protein